MRALPLALLSELWGLFCKFTQSSQPSDHRDEPCMQQAYCKMEKTGLLSGARLKCLRERVQLLLIGAFICKEHQQLSVQLLSSSGSVLDRKHTYSYI